MQKINYNVRHFIVTLDIFKITLSIKQTTSTTVRMKCFNTIFAMNVRPPPPPQHKKWMLPKKAITIIMYHVDLDSKSLLLWDDL